MSTKTLTAILHTVALRRSLLALSFFGALLVLPYFASAQTYGGGVYGGGDYNVGTLPAAAAAASSGGNSAVVGSGPTAPGYVNINPTGTEPTPFPTNPGASAPTNFTRDLEVGAAGEEVRQLQILLNSKGFTVAQSGPGSPGNETLKFGAATKAALIKFQLANNITPAVGYFGPKTRAAINGTSPSQQTTQPSGATDSSFTRDLEVGAVGEDVRALQRYLNAQGFTVAQSGPGSTGNETLRFGAATKAALIKFQEAKGITPAAGYFGPKTRAAIAQ